MARDRQRAKQRRRRQPGAGPSGTGPARKRPPREIEAEAEPSSSVFPQRGDVQPVEPDDELVPSEDELVAYEESVEPAPDELDPAVREEGAYERTSRRQRGRIFTFLGHVIDELRRVQWPDRTAVTQATAVVIVFCILAGLYLALFDWVFSRLVKAIL